MVLAPSLNQASCSTCGSTCSWSGRRCLAVPPNIMSPSGWCRALSQCCRGQQCSGWARLCPGRRAATPRRSRTNPSSLPASRRVLMQYLLSSPDFGTWSRSRSGPMSKKSPEKGPICLSSPEVHKCDFELCTDATVCILFLRGRHHQLQYSICTVNLWKKYVKT